MRADFIMRAAANSLGQGKREPFCGTHGDVRSALMETEWADYASEYGEPGYDNPKCGIVFANWNKFPRETTDLLERAGYAVEWSDEWTVAHETGKAYRTSPDCYSWKPYYVATEDGEIIGGDEIECGDQLDWYVNEYLLNDPTRANVFNLDLEALGFVQYNRQFESGWHPGQDDKPADVFARIRCEMPDHDVVFSLDSRGQFDCYWTAWVRKTEIA